GRGGRPVAGPDLPGLSRPAPRAPVPARRPPRTGRPRPPRGGGLRDGPDLAPDRGRPRRPRSGGAVPLGETRPASPARRLLRRVGRGRAAVPDRIAAPGFAA